MQFRSFAALIRAQFDEITANGEAFHVAAPRDDLWDAYLAAFPEGTNPVFRERARYDCSCCRQFVKGVGGLVTLSPGGELQTIWDVQAEGYYRVVAATMGALVRGSSIDRVYRTQETRYGVESNEEAVDGGPSITWHHFNCRVPARLVNANTGEVTGQFASTYQVLGRGLKELDISAVETVEDLITSNSLYRGEEHLRSVRGFGDLKRLYNATPEARRANFVWACLGHSYARFRNTAIGTLVQDLSAGMGLNGAVRRFEAKVAPHNYRRSSAPITKGMIDRALQTLRSLGLENAVHRRFATIADVSPNDVVFVDRSVRPHMKDALSETLMEAVKPHTRQNAGAVDIDAAEFFEEVLPGAEGVEVQLGREHLGNFVTITAPKHETSRPLFRWHNGFAWVYDGNVTDSIKQRVKAAGGNVDALLRVSLSWFNGDDLDIHCMTPHGRHIFYGDKRGVLDVDMNAGRVDSRAPVENLAWNQLDPGEYNVFVHQYERRESVDVGFEIEYAHHHDVRQLSYPKALRRGEKVQVCSLQVKSGEVVDVTFNPALVGGGASTSKWGVNTGGMVPVETIMLSPNHWGQVEARTGNRHHVFILRGCKNPDRARGFFNEYLHPELHQHRKVFEVLADKLKCEPTDVQLSGVGFSSTRHDRATFAVQKAGATRTYNVQF